VDACGDHGALAMLKKDDPTLKRYQRTWNFYTKIPETPKKFINEKLLTDMMLAERSLLYVGGAGSCMGCGEGTALRMMLAATGFVYGKENIGIVNSTGCSTVYASTYPYNPYLVPWTNSLFENAPADAMGIRARWDQMGWKDKQLWVIGGDGAMLDIGFQSLSRMLASGMNIKVPHRHAGLFQYRRPVLNRSYMGQNTKFGYGSVLKGRSRAQGTRADLHDAPEHLRGADQLCDVKPLLQIHHRRERIRRPAVVSVYDLPARTRRGHGDATKQTRRGHAFRC
jgi:hypothetical protein